MRTRDILMTLATVVALVSCSTGRTSLVIYENGDLNHVRDSIEASGTVMGEWRRFYFNLEDEGMDPLIFTTLYDKKGNAKGSVQARDVDGRTEIRILDKHK